MAQNIFCIDGKYYNVVIPEKGIKRSFSVADSDKAGRAQSGSMIRDIIGTYYNYTIQLDTSLLSEAEYDELYETLSAPADYHTITVPYGQTSLTYKAYVTGGDDTLVREHYGTKYWSGLSVNFIATDPLRRR